MAGTDRIRKLVFSWRESIVRAESCALMGLVFLFLNPVLPAEDRLSQTPPDHAERVKAGTDLFRKTIRTALVERCLKCHGGEKVRSGFDLSSRKLFLDGGDSGEVIDLEDPSSSYLLQLIRHDDEPAMPPASDKLSDQLIADMQRWIELGAPYDKPLIEKENSAPTAMQVTESDRQFWSFRPLTESKIPSDDGQWSKTEIDRFINQKLIEQKLTPNPPAEDLARIRRAYLDVIGLPPTLDEIQSALSMTHSELVDNLLSNPHYGQRWARHWLDAARFAESHGFEQDYDRKFAYHFRDFVIKALNSDMPWDQFVRWQIAGDEIAPTEPLAMMATGFLGAGVFPTQLTEKEFESARYDELDDMAATIGTAMLGLTIGCARCHDHKFDPLPVKDYYRFVSTFTTTIRSEIDVDLQPDLYRQQLATWTTRHNALVAARDSYQEKPDVGDQFARWMRSVDPESLAETDWTILSTISAESSQNATTLTVQDDGSILASGDTPTKEMYTVIANTSNDSVRFIRLEALTDASMKRKGPGRAGNGNFALSNFRLFAIDTKEGKTNRRLLKLINPQATHQQNEQSLSVASAIDSESSSTGWAVDAGGIGKDQAAVFELENPIAIGDETKLELQLTFSNNAKHSLGRFRVSVSATEDAPLIVGGGRSDALGSRNQCTQRRCGDGRRVESR